MENCWPRQPTPSMVHNRSQNKFKAGYQPGPRIQSPNMRPPSSGINWLNFVSVQGKIPTRTQHPDQSSSSPAATPIQRALMNSSNTPAPPAFEPACLLTLPTTTNQWRLTLVDHMPSTLDFRITDAQRAVFTTNIEKTEAWWGRQPAEAIEMVQRVAGWASRSVS